MRVRAKRILCFFVFCVATILFLPGCILYEEAVRVLNVGRRMITAENYEADKPESGRNYGFIHTFLIERSDITLAMYEPSTGAYLGVNTSRDRRVADITAFDRLTGKDHAIWAISMSIDEPFDADKALTASVLRKALLVTVLPPTTGDVYNAEHITRLATEIGRFDLPIFVNFYPYSRHHNFNATRYRAFFRMAYHTFRQLAPNAAMVWSVNVWDVETSSNFYPGHQYVDWVGIEIAAHINREGEYDDFMTLFELFSLKYQDVKPIMVTSLSFSHFSTLDNRYRTALTTEAIRLFYGNIAAYWPRVKAIVYFGYNDLETGRGRGRNNTTVTGEESILEAYRAAIADEWFLSRIVTPSEENTNEHRQFVTRPSAGAWYGGRLYISENAALGAGIDISGLPRTRLFGEYGFPAELLPGSIRVRLQ